MPLDAEVGLCTGDIVLDEDPAPPPQKTGTKQPPEFGPIYCDQTAGWIKMPLGTEIDLGPGHIALDGDPASIDFYSRLDKEQLPSFTQRLTP